MPVRCGKKSQPDACCEDFGDSIRARGVELSVAIEYTNRIQGIELPTVFGWPLGTFRWYPLPVTPSYSIRVAKIPAQEAYFFGPPKDGTGGFALPAMNSETLGHQYRVNTLSSGILVTVRSSGEFVHVGMYSFVFCILGFYFADAFGNAILEKYIDTWVCRESKWEDHLKWGDDVEIVRKKNSKRKWGEDVEIVSKKSFKSGSGSNGKSEGSSKSESKDGSGVAKKED